MVVIFILIGLSLIVALIFLSLYIWSVKDGQYDDDYTPAIRILFDDNPEDEDEDEVHDQDTSESKKNKLKTK